jgi:transcriptional regulator with XRE-family HTH domain
LDWKRLHERTTVQYLLSYRKRSALSQGEVAFLLGIRSGSKISHYERFNREPGLQTALAYEAIYQKPVSELFPGLFEKIQREVKARAKILEHKTFSSSTIPVAARKRKTLAAIVSAETKNQLTQS